MKRTNKGFTLIELLAIIVILAIIAVITVPLILNIINDAQKNASIDSAYGYKSALEKYYMKKVVENTENELPNGYKNISELPEDFIVSGESPSEGWVKLKKGLVDKFSLKYDDYVVTMDNEKNVTSEKQENVDPRVPDEYKEVEYLESTGTQYIDTGYVPQQTDYLELNNVTRKSEGALFSAGTGSYQLIYMNVGSNNYFKYFATGTAANFQLSSYIDSKNIKVYNNNLYIDDELYATSAYSGDVNTDLRLFARKGNTNYIGAQVGNVMIKHDNTLVRNLVPVIRKSDNKPGLLDLANLSRNLFDRESQVANTQEGMHAGTPNAYLKDDGSEVSSSGWWITDFIGIYSDTVTISGVTNNTPSICLYDDNKSLLTCTRYSGNESITISASGAKYVRFSLIRNTNTSVMLNEGTEALPYEPYKKSFYTNDGTGEFIAGPEI